jgi:hypothetical protein
MAFYDTDWFISSVGYAAVPAWAAAASTPPGTLRRQLAAPAVGSERVFVATQLATQNTGATEPTWVITRGGKTTDGSVTWQECTGAAAVNGDMADVATWAQAKAIGTPTLGAIIKSNSGVTLLICSIAGSMGAAEPGWALSAGGITTDGTSTWVTIGNATSFAAWSAPHARTLNACAAGWGLAGHDFYLADNSAEVSTASISLGLGNSTTYSRYMSVDHTAALPATPSTLKAGASMTSSLAAANAITIGNVSAGSQYFNGITFTASAAFAGNLINTGGGTTMVMRYENCAFNLTGGLAGSYTTAGPGAASAGQFEFINCTFGFSNAGQYVQWGGGVITWRNTPDPCFTGTIPSPPVRFHSGNGLAALIEGVDFTSLGAGTLFTVTQGAGLITLKNCKLHTGPVTPAVAAQEGGLVIDLINCDSGSSVRRNERHTMEGDLTTSNAVYRTGGALDGGAPISWMLSSSTYARPTRPLNALPLVIWNDVVGTPRTVTLYGYMAFGLPLPFNDQFWFDVEYMGSTASPIASFVSNGLATPLTPHAVVAVADPASVWNVIGSSTPFSLSATFTAQQKGYVTIYPKAGLSQTVGLDPRPVLS